MFKSSSNDFTANIRIKLYTVTSEYMMGILPLKELTRFMPLVSFYTHWKHQKTLGDIETDFILFVYKEQVIPAILSDMHTSAKRADKLIKHETIEKNRAKNTSV